MILNTINHLFSPFKTLKLPKAPVIFALVAITLIATLTPNSTLALNQVNTTKSSTSDFNQGTNSNLSTASDEMKMNPTARTAWYQTGGTWNYRKKIVIDHTKVPNTDQTDFPVLINLASDSDLASKAQDDGDDLLLTQEDQKTKLSHEIESFNGTTGALVLWVKIPSLSHTYDTTVYLYYGNASATSQQNKTDVWSNGYMVNYHFNETSWNGSVGELKNAVSSSNPGTLINSGVQPLSAKIGNGAVRNVDGSDGYLKIENSRTGLQPDNMSVNIWAKYNGPVQNSTWSGPMDHRGDRIGYNFYRNIYNSPANKWECWTGSDAQWHAFGTAEVGDTWHLLTMTRSSVNTIKFYVDGVFNAETTGMTSVDTNPNYDLLFMRAGGNPFIGAVDEANISSTARSADWIATEYANQNDPSSFYSVQSETAKSSVLIADDNISTDWYHADWKYRRQITIDHTKVPNTDQTEFPMLVKIADSTDPIFTKAQADGDDLLFTNNYGNTKLSHEIETFSTENKELWAWVKIPVISTSVDTKIWLYYGNAGVQNQQSATAVWSNGYAGAWHMDEASGNINDSTSNNYVGVNNGAGYGSVGKIGTSLSFDGSNKFIAVTSPRPNTYNLSFWAKINAWDGTHFFTSHSNYSMDTQVLADGTVRFQTAGANQIDSNIKITDTNWHQYNFEYDGTTAYIYIDGVVCGSGQLALGATGTDFLMGKRFDGVYYHGLLDNLVVSSTVRSDDWIATEYANQNSPETFAQIGKEVGYYPASSSASWYGEGGAGQKWAYRQKITIDNANVPNTDQTDFPVLVKITDQANGIFAHAQADGDDIVFTASDQYTKLSHEIETFSTSSHELWAWVKVPILSHSIDTVLYMYYGNPSSPNQQNKTNVWTNGYGAVYHLDESTGDIADSINTNTQVRHGSTQASSKVGYGQSFSGSTWTEAPDSASLRPSSAITSEFWMHSSAYNYAGPLWKGPYGDVGWPSYGAIIYNFGTPTLYSRLNIGGYQDAPNTALTNDSWYHILTTWRSGEGIRTYVNGSLIGTGGVLNGVISYNEEPLYIGKRQNEAGFNGLIDEVRVSNVARSSDWVATQYANQSTPELFYDIDPEVADPGTGEWFPARGTWSARQAVTIDHTKVPNTDQVDFPVLVKITNQSNGVFSSAQADGDDILFTSSDGKTKLSHEIEQFSQGSNNNALWAWVKVPSLTTATDTTLYMYYGNSTTTNQENSADVWSNGYAGVWHGNDATTSTISDSTINAYTGNKKTANRPVQAGGKISFSQDLDGSSDNISMPPIDSYMNGRSSETISAWFSSDTVTGLNNIAGWHWNRYGALWLHGTGAMAFSYETTGGATHLTKSWDYATDRTWHHMVGTYDIINGGKLYVDGLEVASAAANGSIQSQDRFAIGSATSTSGADDYHFDGKIDQVSATSTARSPDWIATEYNNQNSPETFESFGMEQTNVSYASPNSTSAGSGIINTVWNGGWGTPNGFSSAVNIPTNTSINFQMRSSATGGSIDNGWTAWSDLGTATTTGTFTVAKAAMPQAITTGTNKYIQVLATPSSDSTVTSTLSDYTVSYMADATAPSNPTTTSATVGGTAITTSTWTPLSGAVNFTFSGSSDGAAEESGLAGYYTYFGTDPHADPSNYQSHAGAVGDAQSYSSSIAAGDDGKYFYFRIKTKDVAGNISSASTLFDFGYDITSPSRPSFVASDPAGYTTNNSFSFSWPAAEDVKTAGGWYSNSWTKRQKITFDKDKVPNTDQTDFPVLVKIIDPNNELFTTAKTNGYDILFTSANGTTKLSHEIEKYDATTKELWAWVKLPVLSHSTDTNIYMYYGNSAATDQQNKTDVWSNGYAGVWHMGDGTTLTPVDSSPSGRNGTISGSVLATGAAGRFAGGGGFTGSSKITFADPQIGSNFGVSMWIKPASDFGNSFTGVFDTRPGLINAMRVYGYSGKVCYDLGGGGCTGTAIPDWTNQWHRLDDQYTAAGTNIKFYIDGGKVFDGNMGRPAESYCFVVGATNSLYFNGLIDEVRISSTARSADWIAAEYANQNSPETFMEVSSSSGGSDIKYYEYKRATAEDTDWSHTADGNTRTVSGIEAYQEGANAFYVRSVDNAGNASTNYQQVTYYWSGKVPAKPNNLSVSPDASDNNSFTVSWDKPQVEAGDPPVAGYYYSINEAPTMDNLTYISSTDEHITLGPDAFATKQGINTIYVLSANINNRYALDEANYAQTSFTCQTPALPAPIQASLVDSSDRTLNRWMLTLQWKPANNMDTNSFDHYIIYRSTDGQGFSELATTSSTAYIDSSNLDNQTTYYYNIKAVDNASKESAQSTTVSKQPTGKFLTPPNYLSTPDVSDVKSASGKIAWLTDRSSTSIVRYGKSKESLSASSGQMDLGTSHEVNLMGLDPGTLYYYQVQSLDENRDYSPDQAYSTTYNFETLPAPTITNVEVTNITLTSADVSWETTTVSSSSLYYGKNSSFASKVDDISGSSATRHSVKLSSLTHSSKYSFRLSAKDIDGNELTSDNYNFETLPMPRVDSLKATLTSDQTRAGAKITWTTNVDTSSIVKYSIDGKDEKEVVKSKLSKEHEIIIEGLLDQATYKLSASGRDSLGNLTDATSASITTPKDSRPPQVSNVSIETSNVGLNKQDKAQAVISWHSDEPATSRVEYGIGLGGDTYEKMTKEDTNLSQEHVVIINDLDPTTPYHIRINSKDAAGNEGKSDDQTVISSEVQKSTLHILLDALTKAFAWIHI